MTPAGGSSIITGNSVAGHASKEHPQSQGLVGVFFRRKVSVFENGLGHLGSLRTLVAEAADVEKLRRSPKTRVEV